MFGEKNPEVLIVGAGPVGQFAALALAKRSIDVRIVDRGIWPCAQSYALALHRQSLRLLDEFGLLDAVLRDAVTVPTIALYRSAGRHAEIHLDQDGSPTSCLAVVRQEALEAILERSLEQQGVKVEWRHEVPRLIPATNGVSATVHKFEKESRGYIVAHTEWVVAKSADVTVPFVIGADGYNSRVRRASKIEFPETASGQYYAVFEFKTDAVLEREMRIVLGNGTTDVLWPLPDGNCRWSFELPGYRNRPMEDLKENLKSSGFDVPTARVKERMATYETASPDELDEAALRALIAERAPWFTGSVENLLWHSVVRFERRLAGAFGGGRMWLAGDSAHLTGPVGVQSMNLGLQEAGELASIIAAILRDDQTWDRLDAYNRNWTKVWRQLHGIEGSLRPAAGADAWIGQQAQRLMACLPAHGSALAAMAAQIGLTLEVGAAAATS